MQKKEIKVEKNARYFVLGNKNKKIKKVWIVFHGYGQLANYFLKNFEKLDDGETLIIAPEGLHRFYWKGFSDKVVASWMTKEDREKDIEDYIVYLNKLWEEIKREYNIVEIPITLFAYSQGVATLCRWYLQANFKPNQLILWAGTLAHDIDYNMLKQKLTGVKCTQLFGDKDEFFKVEQIDNLKSFLNNKNLKIDFQLFDGGHEILPSLLKTFH